MKVTKKGVIFTDTEMREFVFPMMRQGLSKQLDSYYDKDCPKPVRANLKGYLEKFVVFAGDLQNATGVKTLYKNNQHRWGLSIFNINDNPRFVTGGGGVGLTERVICKKPVHVTLKAKK